MLSSGRISLKSQPDIFVMAHIGGGEDDADFYRLIIRGAGMMPTKGADSALRLLSISGISCMSSISSNTPRGSLHEMLIKPLT